MGDDYTKVHDWIMACATSTGSVDLDKLLAYPVVVDPSAIINAAWELEEDGWLTYSPDDRRFYLTKHPRLTW